MWAVGRNVLGASKEWFLLGGDSILSRGITKFV